MRPGPTPADIFLAKIYYKTKNGADLLNPQTSGYFNKDGIKVFDVATNGNSVQMNSPSSFNTFGISTCNGYVCQPDKEALIQLNSSVTDTLTYQIISATPQLGFYINNIYYKGQVLWSKSMPNANTMTIVK